MDDHRRTPDGYAPTVAAPSGGVPAGQPRPSPVADTELASGTGMRGGPATEKTGPVVGGMIGRFTIVTPIGSDPIGVVYAARDEANRLVAIKLVHAGVAHAPYRSRLVRDAPGLALLAHPSLVQIDEIGVAFGRPFIAMEFVEGPLLPAWLEGKHAWDAIVDVFAEIGGALAAGHRAGFGHGDWTPHCVLVEPSGRPRVIDVGLGRFDPVDKGVVDFRVDQLRWAVALRGALGGGSEGDPARWATVPEAVRAAVMRAVDVASPQRFASMSDAVDALDVARGRRSSPAIRGPRAEVMAPSDPSGSGGGALRRVGLAIAAVAILGGAMTAAYLVMAGKPEAAPAAPPVAVAPAPAPTPSVTATPIPIAPTPTPAPEAGPPAPVVAPARAGRSVTLPKATAVAPAPAPVAVASPAAPSPSPSPPPPSPPRAADPGDSLALVREALTQLGWSHAADPTDAATPGLIQSAITQLVLGVASRAKGDCTTASSHWVAAIQVLGKVERDEQSAAQPYLSRAEFQLGLCALAVPNYQGAISFFQRAIPLMPEDDVDYREALFAEGLAYWQLDDPADASHAIRAALARAPAADSVHRAMTRLQGPLFGGRPF